ncbi:PTS glucose transporter subunit IIBC [Shewanella psychrotolerans]|uniref:PTS glucose transporter subunit IIBC n=1 Tax=Shewanella psychrotolerans TaxID=2864206 RepID=UPI001C65A163|nr:PTS glucose transporter subunit IIBC [Shewanella psychrotolerans]QYK00721.1 PTS glucose transporter subunit IIBC [Shewanella psychrotolerans]
MTTTTISAAKPKKAVMAGAFSVLQKVGKAVMLPVSVLPVAGILLGVGSAGFSIMPDIVNTLMVQAGEAIFDNMGLLFAIGIALGFAKNDGVAAMAALVGYAIMIKTIGVMSPGTDVGVLGGMIAGAIAAYSFNRFFKIQLPSYLGFFSGKRSVPIITGFGAIFAGVILSFIWPPIGHLIATFSHWAANQNPILAFGIYGMVERSLIPAGLHHVWNVPFFFEAGSCIDSTGKAANGVLTCYLQANEASRAAGNGFGQLAGGYLFKMFGLPAAAMAIWHTARPENRAMVGGIMISAALTSFLTGITEPIEFAFMFVAPLLYVVHALMAGLAYVLVNMLGVVHGTSFSHGLFDFLLLSGKAEKIGLLVILGLIYAALYYVVFRFLIVKFDLKTPGRTDSEAELVGGEGTERAQNFIEAFGGPQNLVNVDSCITRLRMDVLDASKVDHARLKQLGASGVLVSGNAVQAIVGTIAEVTRTEIDEMLASGGFVISAPTVAETVDDVAVTSANMEQALQLKGLLGEVLSCRSVADNRLRIEVSDSSQLDLDALKTQGVEEVLVFNKQLIHLLFAENTAGLAAALTETTNH